MPSHFHFSYLRPSHSLSSAPRGKLYPRNIHASFPSSLRGKNMFTQTSERNITCKTLISSIKLLKGIRLPINLEFLPVIPMFKKLNPIVQKIKAFIVYLITFQGKKWIYQMKYSEYCLLIGLCNSCLSFSLVMKHN